MRIQLRTLVPSLLLVACGTAPSAAPDPGAPPAATPNVPAPAPSILDEELATTLAGDGVTSALAVVLDARSGRVLAMQSVSGETHDPTLPERERFPHGSVAKTFTFAIALDRGAIGLDDRL